MRSHVRFVFFTWVFLAGLAKFFAITAEAGPVIENLDVRAVVTEQGILSVEETLTVLFDENPLDADLTRGISGRYADGEKNRTGFVLLDATLDGQSAKTSIRRGAESLRLTLGARADVFRPGPHVFRLKYELIGLIAPDGPQDTLLWQVVRDSSTVIRNLTVRVALPGGASFDVFTGRMGDGSDGEGMRVNLSGFLETLLPLPQDDSATVRMTWPGGLVTDRADATRAWRLRDTAVLIILICYYLFIHWRYGRLPRRGTFVPGTDASGTDAPGTDVPGGLSPGLLRALWLARFDARVLTAEILNLAVRGFIHIDDFTAEEPQREIREKNHAAHHRRATVFPKDYSPLERMMKRRYRLCRLDPPAGAGMNPNMTESLLLHNLFQDKDSEGKAVLDEIVLDGAAAPRIERLARALKRRFAELGRDFLFPHMKLWAWGIFFFEAYTAFAMFHVLSQGVGGIEPNSEHALAFMAPLFFLAPFLGGEKMQKQSTSIFILRTCIPLFFCACALGILSQQGAELINVLPLAGCIAVIGFFWKTAPARSVKGVRLLDETESFRLELGSRADLTEEDTLEKFERLLPYSCALNREQALIARYDPLIVRLRHHARWHTADTHSFVGGAEYFSLAYELEEAIRPLLRGQRRRLRLSERESQW